MTARSLCRIYGSLEKYITVYDTWHANSYLEEKKHHKIKIIVELDGIGQKYFTSHDYHLFVRRKQLLVEMIVDSLVSANKLLPRPQKLNYGIILAQQYCLNSVCGPATTPDMMGSPFIQFRDVTLTAGGSDGIQSTMGWRLWLQKNAHLDLFKFVHPKPCKDNLDTPSSSAISEHENSVQCKQISNGKLQKQN